ncbi:MAG: WG repeat-containing protein [Clostridia bacterium]|nr:WG repeat-containing protein [Clostridia bacterium]
MKKICSFFMALALVVSLGTITAHAEEFTHPSGVNGYSAVAAGDWHSLAIDEQGRLYTWGSNCFGQLGNGKRTEMNYDAVKVTKNADVYTPTRLRLEPEKRFVHVTAGAMHSIALDNSGMLYAWGNNYDGQLGIGTQEIQTSPVLVMTGVRYASARNNTTVAVKTDGTLWIWGEQDPRMYGENPDERYIFDSGGARNFSPRQAAAGAVMAAGDSSNIFYIDEAGQLWGIGSRAYLGVGDEARQAFEAEPVPILPDVVDIAPNGSRAVDVKGDLYAWGRGETPTRLMGDVARIASGGLVLKRDGSLWGYLGNSVSWDHYRSDGSSFGYVHLYSNDHDYRYPKEMVKLLDHVRFAGGGQHSLAMDEDGVLYGWGCNVFGQAGTGKRTQIKYYYYKDDEVGEIYDFYVDKVQDAHMPVKLPALKQAKNSAKVTVADTLPEPAAVTVPDSDVIMTDEKPGGAEPGTAQAGDDFIDYSVLPPLEANAAVSLAAVFDGEKWGFINREGKVVIESQWDSAYSFSEDLARVRRSADRSDSLSISQYGFIDRAGNLVIDLLDLDAYDPEPFSEGLAFVMIDGKYGCIDPSGNVVIKPRWEDTRPFSGGLAAVYNGRNWGFIDQTGKVVIKPQWKDRPSSFSEGLLLYDKNDKIGFMDNKGKVALKPKWDFGGSFHEGLAFVFAENNYIREFIDAQGNVMFTMPDGIYFYSSFSEGCACITATDYSTGKSLYGFIDRTGSVIIEPEWDYAAPFSEGLAFVTKDEGKGDKRGFIDRAGNVVSEPQWDEADSFSNGLARVKKDGKWGFIDREGNVVIEPQWEKALSFH